MWKWSSARRRVLLKMRTGVEAGVNIAKLNEMIAGLTEHAKADGDCYGCTYRKELFCHHKLCKDVLDYIKAQEPRKPHYTTLEYLVNGVKVSVKHPECPKCFENGKVLWDAEIEKDAPYCKRCGQAIQW